MEKPVNFAYDNQMSSYTMAPAAVPPQPLTPITPITPLTAASDLPTSSNIGNDYYRRDSYPSPPGATPSSSGSSASYTSPPYSEMVLSPTNSETRRTVSNTSANTTQNSDYDMYSPLNGLPETESIAIPPLLPPPSHLLKQDFDDFDSLPDLLRQDRKADYTPRRPMNIYFIYMRVRRPELALHNPNLSTGDLSKLLGKEWNSMSPDQKAPWNELAECLMRAFKKKFPDYQYERGGGKKALKKRPRPNSITVLNSNRAMVDAAASVAARRASASHHHAQLHHAHMAHLPGRPMIDPSHGHGPVWEHGAYVYRTSGADEYGEYAPYPHTPVYAALPTPLPTPGLPPQSYPPYGYEYASPPNSAPLSAPLDSHHMAHPAGAAYPFPLHSPGFAPSSGPGARASASQDNMSGYYSQQQAHYAPVTEASSPWDEYMVQ